MTMYTPQNAWNPNSQTGLSVNPGPFIGEVMRNNDPLFSGRLLVYIPDMGGDPTQESSWDLVRYMSPFYGIQPLANRLPQNREQQSGAIESYGMWMNPPDVGVKVLVMFVNGDRSRGVWMGCLPEIGSHGAIPGQDAGDFDVFTNYSAATADIKGIARPPHSTAPTFATQGLAEDAQRGPITSSSLRESPSRVFGFNTPGSHSFVMDDGAEDGTNKLIRVRTAGGNQIMMNDDSGFVYLINAAGTGWIELSPSGHIDVYGEAGINMATKGSINMHADQNINMHAGQHIKIVAQVGAKIQGTEEMQVHGGRLWLEGVDTIEQHSCGQIKLTGFNGMFFKSFDNFVLQGKCFRWNSGTALEAEQVPPEETKDVNGYTTTVERAPNREPWDGHESSNSAPSSAIGPGLGVDTGTPLSIPVGGSINDLLPPSAPGSTNTSSTTGTPATSSVTTGSVRFAADGSVVRPATNTTIRTNAAVVSTASNVSAVESRVTVPATSRTPVSGTTAGRTVAAAPNRAEAFAAARAAEAGKIVDEVKPAVAPNRADAYRLAREAETALPGTDAEQTETMDPAAEAAAAYDTVAGQEAFSSIPALPGGGNTGYFATGDNCARPTDGGFGQSVGPQGGGGAFPGAPSNVIPPAELVNDPEWQAELARLKQEFPALDEQELYRIIQGESGFNSTAVNPDSGASGFFQFIPSTAAGLGTTTGAIQNMTPAQQLEVYGRYLRQSNYQGGPLGMIQAAPGTYRNLIGKYGSWSAVPRDTEVYAVGSKAWQQNPGWRDSNGRVTIGGIESYYAKQ